MNCRTCQSKMTLLFTSYVCDVCNPSEGVVAQSTVKPTYQKMWIYYNDTDAVTRSSYSDLVYPQLKDHDAITITYTLNKGYFYNLSSRLFHVYFNGVCEPDKVKGAYLVESEEKAIQLKEMNYSAVWLCG